MAISNPDVGLLTTSAQIFASNHTLPQIRSIHKALHVQVEDKAARLRTQVGGSYRELLGTADAIVQMRTDMDAVQGTLAGMGGRCGRAVVGSKVAALANFVESREDEDNDEVDDEDDEDDHDHEKKKSTPRGLALTARARLLEACARTVGRLLSRSTAVPASYIGGNHNSILPTASAAGRSRSGSLSAQQHYHSSSSRLGQRGGGKGRHRPDLLTWGERLVLAAKVLMLSRLLVTSLGEAAEGGKPSKTVTDITEEEAALRASVQASKKTLGGLRRRLRDIVEILERSVPASAWQSPSSAETADDANDDDSDANDDDDGGASMVSGVTAGAARSSAAAAGGAASRDDLLKALCAHSLATTSGAEGVLWQLLHVRSQAMALAFDALDHPHHQHHHPDSTPTSAESGPRSRRVDRGEHVLRGLALYTKTLLDVQALLPHRLPEALLGLKKRPLLDDEALRHIEALRLDVYARWCGDDVQYFKPYIRHDDLDAAKAREMLNSWAERGGEVLLAGLRKAMATTISPTAAATTATAATIAPTGTPLDLRTIVDLRTRVLQLWIRDSSKARGLDPAELLDQMRAVFNEQMLAVVSAKVGKLRLVGSEVAATLAAWRDGVTDRHASVWGSELDGPPDAVFPPLDTDLSSGAVPFMHDVVSRLHGRSDAVAKANASYASWRRVVNDVDAMVDELRRQRWDNDVDDMVEDEDTIAQRQQALSRDDPQQLHKRLAEALAAAFADLDKQLAGAWTHVDSEADNELKTKGRIAMYLVRVLREIRSRRPTAVAGEDTASMASLGLEIVPALHTEMVAVVVALPLSKFGASVLARTTVAGRALWESSIAGSEGLVALPSSPSPGVFKFVRDLIAAMDGAGMDLWSPAAVVELKRQVSESLAKQWTEKLATAEHLNEVAAEEAESEKEEEEEQEKEEEEDREKEAKNGETDEEEKKDGVKVENGDEEGDKDEKTDGNEESEEEAEEKNNDKKEEGEKKEQNGQNGHAKKTKPAPKKPLLTSDQRRDLLLQWLFDVAWLRCGLSSADADTKQPLLALEDAIYTRASTEAAKDVDTAARQRITKTANEYWKKTSLLFGMLG